MDSPTRVTVPSTITMLSSTIHSGPNFSCSLGLMNMLPVAPIARMQRSAPPSAICSGIGILFVELDHGNRNQSNQRHKNVREDRNQHQYALPTSRSNHRCGRGSSRPTKLGNSGEVPKKEKANLISQTGLYLMPATTYAPTHLARAVPSALRGLTSVFGMGTGGSPAVRSPTSRSSF